MGLLGVDVGSEDGVTQRKYICDSSAISDSLCTEDQYGLFIVANETTEDPLYAQIYTTKVELQNPQAIHYPVRKTGYYCVSTFMSDPSNDFKAAVVFQNAYGKLPATQIPKLLFFGFAALAYAVVLALWMFLYIQNRSDILPVQNYITAICAFLVVEMITIWGYYDYTNIHGDNTGAKVYLIILSILNSFRNAFTFFLLLIVCLGYGVVKPSLGSLMWKCRALAGAHFLFAVGWTISSYIVPPDNSSPLILIVVLPLSLTMTAFYVWILSALTNTTKELEEKKQHVKAEMYKNLWRLLLASIVVIFGFFFINSLIFANESTLDFITKHWQTRWFLLDGWLNVVYFADFCIIAFIWRPTANNRRFAMSSQLAQDESEAQEFEIGSLRESLDWDEEEAVGSHSPNQDDRQSTGVHDPSSPPPQYSPSKDNKPTDDKTNLSTAAASSSNGNGIGSSGARAATSAGPSTSTQSGTVFSTTDNDSDNDAKKYNKWDHDENDSLFSVGDDDDDAIAEDYEHATESQGLTKKSGKKDV